MAISKLVKLGLEQRAIELKNSRKSDYETAKILTIESGKKISRENVYNYFRTHYKILKKLAEEDAKFQEEVMRQHLDVNAQLLYINQETKAAIEEMEKNGSDPWRRAPLLALLLRQIEFIAKRHDEITAPQIATINQRVEKFESSVIDILLEVGGEELKQKFLEALKSRIRQESR